MLQATSADIIKAYNNINLVQTQLQVLRKDCNQVFDESIWKNATHMVTIAETELIALRICQRMTKTKNDKNKQHTCWKFKGLLQSCSPHPYN